MSPARWRNTSCSGRSPSEASTTSSQHDSCASHRLAAPAAASCTPDRSARGRTAACLRRRPARAHSVPPASDSSAKRGRHVATCGPASIISAPIGAMRSCRMPTWRASASTARSKASKTTQTSTFEINRVSFMARLLSFFNLGPLASNWLPTAYRPRTASVASTPVAASSAVVGRSWGESMANTAMAASTALRATSAQESVSALPASAAAFELGCGPRAGCARRRR